MHEKKVEGFGVRSHRAMTGPRRQTGQALTEVVIAAIILVPMFLLVPIIAKYIHGHHMAQQAARSAAWEATVAEDYNVAALDEEAAREEHRQLIIDRHFGKASAPIQSQRLGDEPENSAVGNPLLNTFSNQPLVTRADVKLNEYCYYPGNTNNDTCEDHLTPGITSTVFDSVESLPDLPFISNLIPSRPSANGMVTSHFELNFQNLRYADGSPASGHAPPRFAFLEPFDAINLKMSTRHTLLVDTWNAAGSGIGHSHDRSVLSQLESGGANTVATPVIGALPSILTTALETILDAIRWIPGIGDIPPQLRIYRTSVDIVPEEHLQQ